MSGDRTATWDAAPVLGEHLGARAYVTGLDGEPTRPVELPSGLRVTIGRDFGSGIRLDHKSVSRQHATLAYRGGTTFELIDRESRNGTFVNGRRVEGTITVEAGTELRIGDRRLLLTVRPGSSPVLAAARPVARDPIMLEVIARCERVASAPSNVLLLGETGTGKEVLARWIHEKSGRAGGPFVAVNCGAIPQALAIAELFGHERGAFSGAVQQRAGHFELASGGTLFLDEVAELGAPTQTALLRALQERRVTRLGSTTPIEVDVRVVAATHRPIDALVREGRFRDDLLYRLDVVRVEIPPLRSRPSDVDALVAAFLERASTERRVRVDEHALAALRAHAWPGNVRQLYNVLERTIALSQRDVIGASDLVDLHRERPDTTGSWALEGRVADVEREALLEALDACAGNQSAAARRLGISRRALIYRMQKHGIRARG